MEHTFKRSWEFNGKRVIDCETCGFAHLDILPTTEELNLFYKEKYYSEIFTFDYDVVDNSYIENNIKNVEYNRDFRKVYNIVSKFNTTKNCNMIDLGCGNSLCTLFFKQKGWDSFAIEPNINSFNYISKHGVKGYNCFIEEINKYKIPMCSFINIYCVLEHVTDPNAVFDVASNLLVNDGIIRIAVPNDFSNGHLAYLDYYNKNANWICYPDHINYFNFESLEKFVKNKGYDIIYKTTDFPLEMLLLSGLDYYNDAIAKSKVSEIVSNFNNSLLSTGNEDAMDKFYENMAHARFGRRAEIYARKRG